MKRQLNTLALMALITSTAFAGFNAPLPEFKTPEQLAVWRAEMAAKSAASTKATTQDTAFYTGKPYVESTGSYAFKYRNYNPVMASWTSEDPSGFPDGANNLSYAPIPTISIDATGLSQRIVYQDYLLQITNEYTFYMLFMETIEKPWLIPFARDNAFTAFKNSVNSSYQVGNEVSPGHVIHSDYQDLPDQFKLIGTTSQIVSIQFELSAQLNQSYYFTAKILSWKDWKYE
ncbi:MAG: RHS repeat-associated core domain-containing protein [Luteolibacter sp.]